MAKIKDTILDEQKFRDKELEASEPKDYQFNEEDHCHTFKDKPLLGTSTVVGVIAKPLTWWASGLAVEFISLYNPKGEWKLKKAVDDKKYKVLETTSHDACCVYCGEVAQCQDHFIPHSFLTNSTNLQSRRLTLKGNSYQSCNQCNLLALDSVFDTLEEKREFIQDRLRRKYKKLIKNPIEWEPDELNELSEELKKGIFNKNLFRNNLIKRLAYPLVGNEDTYRIVDRHEQIKQMSLTEWKDCIKQAYKAHSVKLNDSADAGTDLHAELERYVKNTMENRIDTYDDKIVPFITWCNENVEKFLWSEIHTFSEALYVGGISDCGVKLKNGQVGIIDFKSSKESYESQFIQCAGYDLQLTENGGYTSTGVKKFELKEPITFYAIVPFGAEKFTVDFRFNTEELREGFKSAVTLYKLTNK